MIDMPISEGCDRFGIILMNDTVSKEMHDKINERASELFYEAQASLNTFLWVYGYQWENGIVFKRKETNNGLQ